MQLDSSRFADILHSTLVQYLSGRDFLRLRQCCKFLRHEIDSVPFVHWNQVDPRPIHPLPPTLNGFQQYQILHSASTTIPVRLSFRIGGEWIYVECCPGFITIFQLGVKVAMNYRRRSVHAKLVSKDVMLKNCFDREPFPFVGLQLDLKSEKCKAFSHIDEVRGKFWMTRYGIKSELNFDVMEIRKAIKNPIYGHHALCQWLDNNTPPKVMFLYDGRPYRLTLDIHEKPSVNVFRCLDNDVFFNLPNGILDFPAEQAVIHGMKKQNPRYDIVVGKDRLYSPFNETVTVLIDTKQPPLKLVIDSNNFATFKRKCVEFEEMYNNVMELCELSGSESNKRRYTEAFETAFLK